MDIGIMKSLLEMHTEDISMFEPGSGMIIVVCQG